MYAQQLQYEYAMQYNYNNDHVAFCNGVTIPEFAEYLVCGFLRSMKRTMEDQLISHQSPRFGHRFQHQREFRFLRFCEEKINI